MRTEVWTILFTWISSRPRRPRIWLRGALPCCRTAKSSLASAFLDNGQRDPDWNVVSVNGQINCVTVQPDGKSLLCGNFNRVNGMPRAGLARLESNGTLDFSFN